MTDRRMPCYAQVQQRTEAGSLHFVCLLKFCLGSTGKLNECSHCYDILKEELMFRDTCEIKKGVSQCTS